MYSGTIEPIISEQPNARKITFLSNSTETKKFGFMDKWSLMEV